MDTKPDPIDTELHRTDPDYVVHVPDHWDGSTDDGLNEHFLVFEGSDTLRAVWTQSVSGWTAGETRQHNRVVFAYSEDGGESWSDPIHVAGPRSSTDDAHMASWAFPLVSDSGRIYVVYNQHQGSYSWIKMHSGTMAAVYSDDGGRTWADPQTIEMPESPYDDPAGEIPPEWIVWQKPIRDLNGNWLVGYTHWLHGDVATRGADVEDWTDIESVVEFMRFTNVHEDPEPRELQVQYSGWGEAALRVPHRRYPDVSVAQEPSIVRLPDDSLFVVMRSNSGYIWWSRSTDDGERWAPPRPLRYRDHGTPLRHPVAPAPIYELSDGRYLILYHDTPGGTVDGRSITAHPRRPLYLSVGEFRPDSAQPLWFSRPKLLMDTDNLAVDGTPPGDDGKRRGLPMYSSFTTRGGTDVLWYPDRKFFLLGKRITREFLDDLSVPDPDSPGSGQT